MNEALFFLIDTVFTLVLMVVMLRLWLQLVRADFYNPLSQFVVKATNPLIIPMRRFIPSMGPVDTASLVLALLIAAAKVVTIQLLLAGQMNLGTTALGAVVVLVKEAFSLLFWVIVIRAIMSWFSQGRNPMEHLLHQLTEPLLRPIRKIIPPMGGLDLSVLVLLVGLQFLQILVQSLVSRLF
ncbi:YggT family protein [Rheinheimera riviphila]|uniref:YggT family protein n=1 Tax=Rheinheimera riviphila TaxID=1834037 RepID=A0A437QRX2_9GAMM|nr:YggT family protein [Rheinheimera riviphila]RVU37237.1 YggT family protein [Rheinheimera riviphila]